MSWPSFWMGVIGGALATWGIAAVMALLGMPGLT